MSGETFSKDSLVKSEKDDGDDEEEEEEEEEEEAEDEEKEPQPQDLSVKKRDQECQIELCCDRRTSNCSSSSNNVDNDGNANQRDRIKNSEDDSKAVLPNKAHLLASLRAMNPQLQAMMMHMYLAGRLAVNGDMQKLTPQMLVLAQLTQLRVHKEKAD